MKNVLQFKNDEAKFLKRFSSFIYSMPKSALRLHMRKILKFQE